MNSFSTLCALASTPSYSRSGLGPRLGPSPEFPRQALKTRIRGALGLALLLFAAGLPACAASSLQPPHQLVCELQHDPLAIASPHPQLGWQLAASQAQARGVAQSGYRVLAASSPALLASGHADLWDSGEVRSNRTTDVAYQGKPLAPEQQVFWQVEVWDESGNPSGWSSVAQFTTAPAHWSAAWIAAATGAEGKAEGVTVPMPVFRTTLSLRKPVARALLYIAGLGQYEVHLNGAKVGNRELTPAWTDYRRRVLYDTYDVTEMLKPGANAMGVLLGNGMFNVVRVPGRYSKFSGSFGPPRLTAELHLHFRDGTQQTLLTGPNWQTTPGPIVFSSTYGGEDYDARKLPKRWDRPGRIASRRWSDAIVIAGPSNAGSSSALEPDPIPPIRVEHVYQPVSSRVLPSGAQVFDLGQNFAGWPEIAVRGRSGSQVKLICGELLNTDGSVSQKSAHAGPGRAQWFSDTLRGHGVEHWHPRFSYYGFRYVQVEISGHARLLSLAGDAVHSSSAPTGEFLSSNTLLNQIHRLILFAEENNMVSILTDCPHREKLGWLEQTHLMGSALNYDFNLQSLYAKIETDIADEQKPDGEVPTIAPEYVVFPGRLNNAFNDSPEWGSAAVLDPWIAFQRYGDLNTLRAQYPVMRRYVDYLTSRSQNNIVGYGLGDWYDIGPRGPGLPQLTSPALTGTAIYYQDIVTLSAAAHQLGYSGEESRLQPLSLAVAKAFQQRFYHPDIHQYEKGSQTADAMPLVVGLTPAADRAAVLASLVADIRAHANHVTAGDIGFHYVVDALMNNGASNVMLDMLLRTDSPSYGYQLAQGATSLTEAWNARHGSSQDHLMLGDAEEWFYAGMLGLHVDFARRAPEQIVIDPALLPQIKSAQVDYQSVKGVIRVAWDHLPGQTRLDVTIPPNARAVVRLPQAAGSTLLESGQPVAQAAGVTPLHSHAGSADLEIGSGQYHFSIVPSLQPGK